MNGSTNSLPPELREDQRRLVQENIGLVALHIRRSVNNLARPRHDREWEDLFQEGCLGLIRAAVSYDPERGISFAAFALPRIQNAVSRALWTRFSNVYVPRRAARASRAPDADDRASRAERDMTHPAPEIRSNPDAPDRAAVRRHARGGDARRDPVGPDEWARTGLRRRSRAARLGHVDALADAPNRDRPCLETAELDTLRQRLGEKYERAVRRAAERIGDQRSLRGDRRALVEALAVERYLVPHDERKRPLRQIARETRSSYGRVAECDAQFTVVVRRLLEADPEFREMDRLRREHPDGVELLIDEDLESVLARRSADEFIRRFRESDSARRSNLLRTVLECSGEDLEALVHRRVHRLPCELRERLLREAAPEELEHEQVTGGEA